MKKQNFQLVTLCVCALFVITAYANDDEEEFSRRDDITTLSPVPVNDSDSTLVSDQAEELMYMEYLRKIGSEKK